MLQRNIKGVFRLGPPYSVMVLKHITLPRHSTVAYARAQVRVYEMDMTYNQCDQMRSRVYNKFICCKDFHMIREE